MTCGSTMNKRDFELCSVIKFLTKEGKKLKEIHERMNAVCGDVSSSCYQVKFWSKQFKRAGNRLNTIDIQVGQWKYLLRKCAKCGGHDFARSSR